MTAEYRAIYVAGPMTGIPDSNLPAFRDAAAQLRDLGYVVVDPSRHGVAGVDRSWEDCMRLALADMLGCRAVAVLPGWEDSRGARVEVELARTLGMRVAPLALWVPS